MVVGAEMKKYYDVGKTFTTALETIFGENPSYFLRLFNKEDDRLRRHNCFCSCALKLAE